MGKSEKLGERENRPPKNAQQFLRWFLRDELLEEVEGDLEEKFFITIEKKSLKVARRNYWYQVLHYLRPFAIRNMASYSSNRISMYRNYVKVGFRNLWRRRGFSMINIGGFAIGMAVTILIGLWIEDELSFNQYHENYDRIVQVMQQRTFNQSVNTTEAMPFPIGSELSEQYADDFEYVVMMDWLNPHILSNEQKVLSRVGSFMEPDAPHLLSLKMKAGSREGLQKPNSILLSASLSRSLFKDGNPIGQPLKIDNALEVVVTGVYEDLPFNSRFKDLSFIAPWELYISSYAWTRADRENPDWDNNSYMCLAQLAARTDINELNEKIEKVKYDKVGEGVKVFDPKIFLHPMSDWHLKSSWKNGIQKGGLIQYVWLFGIIGFFILILACINFMNLSTAQSERRSQEVGVRKSLGSLRANLISQFLFESFLVVFLSFLIALPMVLAALPFFNLLADKQITFPFLNPIFWLIILGFLLLTGFLAGSYPALYISAFQPVKVLNGTFKATPFATVFRKGSVIIQFTVSVMLIIGTIAVDQQIQHSKNRLIGYEKENLIMVEISSTDYNGKFNLLQSELKKQGAISEMTQSSSPVHGVWNTVGSVSWEGKDPNFNTDFVMVWVTHEFGKTVGWEIIEGRDFSKSHTTDSSAYILNEAAVEYMNLSDPTNQNIKWVNGDHQVIGVIKDMVMESPFKAVKPTIYTIDDDDRVNWITLKLNPNLNLTESLAIVESVWKEQVPAVPFEYQFADQTYAEKFNTEERIRKLARLFAILAILISCLGLFGLASFMAAQRTKEIGIRKVLGASIFNLWSLLAKDFLLLVFFASILAVPIAYFLLINWLENYDYRIQLSWWFFAFACLSALAIALFTVSYQSIKPALSNPVESLRSE